MKYFRLDIPDVILFTPEIFKDSRGIFYESYNKKLFNDIVGEDIIFVQDNISGSKKNVLRGLHYQINYPQGKLVQVISGEVFDVAVDIRKSSKYFGKWVSALLSDKNMNHLWIPPGFAHGFLALTENVKFIYKTTDFYHKESERAIIWNDSSLNIDWPINEPLISKKDEAASLLMNSELFE